MEHLREGESARGLDALGQAFEAAVEQAPAAISITDLDARILYANPMFEQVTGHRVADVLGRNESILSDKRTPRAVYAELWAALKGGEAWSGTLINRRKDKTPYLAELTISPIRDATGTPNYYLGIHRDITRSYQLEQQVLNQKRLIESIIESAPVAVLLLDDAGAVVVGNGAARRMAASLGLGEARLAERVLATVAGEAVEAAVDTPPGPLFEDREVAMRPAADADDGVEAVLADELVWQGTDGTRWFSCSASRLRELDEQADGFFSREERGYRLLVISEVTRLRQQQAEVRRNALRAMVSEEAQVQALREAIGAAEFQLQGPLNLLRAATRLMDHRPGGVGPELEGVLEQVLEAGGQALERLRGAMPRHPGQLSPAVDLNAMVTDALALVTERMLSLGVTVEWRPASELPTIPGHETRLRALLKQLLDNALDALAELPADQPRLLRLRTAAGHGEVELTVEDSGAGIPAELQQRVFEPFFTTRGAAGHVGMGLAIVREIINQHAASVDVLPRGHGCHLRLIFATSSGARAQPTG